MLYFLKMKGNIMDTLTSILILGVVIGICIFIIKIFAKPISLIIKLLLNAASGFIILFLVNTFGASIGFTVGVSFFNAVIAGILGVPGVVLLLILKLLFF